MDTTLLPFPHSPFRQEDCIHTHTHICSSSPSSEKYCLQLQENWTPLWTCSIVSGDPSVPRILTGDRYVTNLLAQSPKRRNLLTFGYIDFHSESENSILQLSNQDNWIILQRRFFNLYLQTNWNEGKEVICTWLWPVVTLNCKQNRLVNDNSNYLYSAYCLSDTVST